jgi:hypothetical protein
MQFQLSRIGLKNDVPAKEIFNHCRLQVALSPKSASRIYRTLDHREQFFSLAAFVEKAAP